MTNDNTTEEEAECPYCGKLFENSIKEGIHRTEKHIDTDQEIKKANKDRNIVDDWKNKASA